MREMTDFSGGAFHTSPTQSESLAIVVNGRNSGPRDRIDWWVLLASDAGIEIDATWQGLGKALFSGESMFWVKCSGTGNVLLSSFLGGEGFVCRFSGQGKVWVQTRYVVPLLTWVYHFRPVKKSD